MEGRGRERERERERGRGRAGERDEPIEDEVDRGSVGQTKGAWKGLRERVRTPKRGKVRKAERW